MLTNQPQELFVERLRKLRRRTLVRVTWYGVARMVGVGGSMLMVTAWLMGDAVHRIHHDLSISALVRRAAETKR